MEVEAGTIMAAVSAHTPEQFICILVRIVVDARVIS